MKIYFKKFLAAFILVFSLSFSPIFTPKALAWDAIPAAFVKQSLEVVWDQVKGALMGAMKQSASMSLYMNMSNFIGGSSSGGALYIKNWEDYLVKQPTEKTNEYINDYISTSVGGKGGSNYEGFGGNYLSQMTQAAKLATSEKKAPKVSYDGDPSQMFQNKDGFKKLVTYASGINNPWAFGIDAEREYQRKLEEEKKLAEVPGIAYKGFLPKGGSKDVSIPGSLLESNMANVQDIGNKVLAGSTEFSEVIITMILNQIMAQMMQEGF